LPRILIADDNSFNLFTINNQLKKIGGIDYENAMNGAEVIEKMKSSYVENRPFSLVLMDCNMPVMDGFEVTICKLI
jgi:CheY-like chemotaxis protein